MERDAHRRIVRYVQTTEPEWDEQEQGWMLALALYEQQRCPDCGQYLPDTTDKVLDANGEVDPVATSRMWVAEPVSQCEACNALDKAAKDHPEHPHIRYSITRRR